MRWTRSLALLGLCAAVAPTARSVATSRASLKPNLRRRGDPPGGAARLEAHHLEQVRGAALLGEADVGIVGIDALRAPKRPTLTNGQVPPQEDGRLDSILNIGESVEDFELRQKPPFVAIPGQEAERRMTKQQRGGLQGIFDVPPDDFQDCVLIHQYAEPLNVIDATTYEPGRATISLSSAEDEEELDEKRLSESELGRLPKKGRKAEEEKKEAEKKDSDEEGGKSPYSEGIGEVFVRPGAVYDSATSGGKELHLGLKMYANLEGISNPVQVVPHGPVAKWSSKWRVPIAGFLCMNHNKSDSAPVLHATPTPCVPTTLDSEGNALTPLLDKYEVWIGSTRLAFDSKLQAERFCIAYAHEIARDLSTTVWDAEQLKFAMPTSQQIEEASPAAELSIGDICYRYCEDGSEPTVNLRSLCPADAPCSSPLTPDSMAFDQCGPRAHTCGGVAPQNATTARAVATPTTAPSPAPPESAAIVPPAPSATPPAPKPAAPAPAETTSESASKAAEPVNLADSEALAEADAAAALADSGVSPPAVEQPDAAQPQQLSGDSARRLRHKHRHHHGHHGKKRERVHKTSLVQLGTNSTLSSEAEQLRRKHRRPKGLAEGRLMMAAGGRSIHRLVQDVNEAGQPSLATIRNPDLLSFVVKSRHRALPQGWTFGTKRLLVVIMDWRAGDSSLSPYSKQDPNPIPHYKNKIFPAVQRHFSEMSYGQFGLDVTFVPEVVRYTKDRGSIAGRLPFPALYNEARESLQGHPKFGNRFAFREYDLVYVIHPQVKPMGTKGVAWVGSRGAVCNGCETISDNFKIMVAVHELGHNLGLSHASSEALEYGNPFDWMGNYPDVVGLHYGLGYKNELGWIKDSFIMEVTDANVDAVNDMITLTPFDVSTALKPGQVAGVRISLKENSQDIYLSYRSTSMQTHRGLYVVYQSKDSPNSKLMDAACHSASQQDAHLRQGWTYMDESQKVVVKVVQMTASHVKVHVYRTPKGAVASIRARKDFTDGRTKCPLTCQDSDLIISQSCASLKDQGYCRGTMRLQGNRLSIGMEVCPVTCGKCKEVLAWTPERGEASCEDKNVKISGMTCPDLLQRNLCDAKTTSGKSVGEELCRKSCGRCPKALPPSGAQTSEFPDPAPARQLGAAGGALPADSCPSGCQAPTVQPGSASNGGLDLQGNVCTVRASQRFGDIRYCGSGGAYDAPDSLDCSPCRSQAAISGAGGQQCPWMCMAPTCATGGSSNGGLALAGDRCLARCSNAYGEQRYCGKGGVYEEPGSIDCTGCVGDGVAAAMKEYADSVAEALEKPEEAAGCEDDDTWVDIDGHNCESYRNTIEEWGKDRVCFKHRNGEGALHCRATCGTCKGADKEELPMDVCADNACIGPWMQAYGRCFRCANFARACDDEDTRDVFRAECPLTCGVCKAAKREGDDDDDDDEEGEEEEKGKDKKSEELEEKGKEKAAPTCEDEDPGMCKDLGMRYCSEHKFAKRCKKTCELCPPPGAQLHECKDLFSSYTCARYESYGWCVREDTRDSVRMQCPATCGVCGEASVRPDGPIPMGGHGEASRHARGREASPKKESRAWRSAGTSVWRWLPLAAAAALAASSAAAAQN